MSVLSAVDTIGSTRVAAGRAGISHDAECRQFERLGVQVPRGVKGLAAGEKGVSDVSRYRHE